MDLDLKTATPIDPICDILSQCSELRVVRMRIDDSNRSSASTLVKLLKLAHLEVSSDPAAISSRLEAPLLQKLHLQQYLYCDIPRGYNALDRFLVRSQCNLKYLELADKSISDNSLIQYLRLPSLRPLISLKIREPTLSKRALRCFAAPSRGREDAYGVLPLLESFTSSKCALPAGALPEVFASRSPQLRYTPQKSLTLKLPTTNHADAAYLDSLAATGTSVCLT
ncbi:hypothetical protein PC9H_010033 [Pleurotus ostreatus]|uniref:Uncharacterized protein n=1 Tax=Pleurotus ostreatus TaxID=5322 RepID=A0A8H7DQ61_PLEOS|nr:uncharacterized protein PC9H_010033 [Pleurotus ostreatus]KAF7424722.1 hypothetical protein PC9H_010033 [Pleurotus ostreatus]